MHCVFFSCIHVPPFTGTIAKLEAARVSNESIIATLRSELGSVQDKLRILQKERKGVENSQLSLNENQTARITTLERVRTIVIQSYLLHPCMHTCTLFIWGPLL